MLPLSFYSFSALFNAITSLVLVPIIIYSKSKVESAKHFLLFLIAVIGWSVFYFLWLITPDPQTAELFARTCMLGVIMMAPLFFHFIASLINMHSQKTWIIANYILAGIFICFAYTPFYLSGMRPLAGVPLWPIPGLLFSFAVAHFVAIYCVTHVFMLKYISQHNGIRREQVLYVFIGTFIGGIAGASNFISWYTSAPPTLNLFTSVYVTTIAYAITRYRLLNIEVIIRKGFVYAVVTAVTSLFYYLMLYATEMLYPGYALTQKMIFVVPAILALSAAFAYMQSPIQHYIDKTFFRSKYDAEKTARNFSEGIKRLVSIDEISEYVTRTSMFTYKVAGAAIFIYDEAKDKFICYDARGTLASQKGGKIEKDSCLAAELAERGKVVLREEAEYLHGQAAGVKSDYFRKISKEMVQKNFKLCVPSISGAKDRRLMGFLALDEKKKGLFFSSDEITLMETLSNQTTSAIENALLAKHQLLMIEKSFNLEKLALLGTATAGVAHETRNALSYLTAFSQMLAKSVDDRTFLDSAAESFPAEVERVKLILQGIMDYSSQHELKKTRMNIRKLVEDTVVLVRDQAKGKYVEIFDKVDDNLEISADSNSMKQVLLNLLINAIDSIQKGGHVEVYGTRQHGKAIITVSDTGCGMADEVLGKIFDPFFTTKDHGTGLGLAIVKKIIQENSGQLFVHSRVGAGTKFTMEFAV